MCSTCRRSGKFEENQRRLTAAAATKEAEERDAASRRAVKRAPYKPGGLSAEERAARLAEMQSNAVENEAERENRLKRASDRDEVEGAAKALQHSYYCAECSEVPQYKIEVLEDRGVV